MGLSTEGGSWEGGRSLIVSSSVKSGNPLAAVRYMLRSKVF